MRLESIAFKEITFSLTDGEKKKLFHFSDKNKAVKSAYRAYMVLYKFS